MTTSATAQWDLTLLGPLKRSSFLGQFARWFFRPPHAQAVHRLRTALECRDDTGLAALLDPGVAVVVQVGEPEARAIKWVSGVSDAVALLIEGLAKPGVTIVERSVNGQAGLLLTSPQHEAALVAVDCTKGLVSMIWVRVSPVLLRHGNSV